MPRFLVYAPDYPDYLEKRLAVRAEHLARGQIDTDSRLVLYSGPILPRPGTKAREATLPEGVPNIAGSFMVYKMDSLEQVWNRLKEDVYWRAGVWDQSRVIVEELLN
ncbi:hypothetical protein L198_03322 [Cryptococcus wingfieldii CBS 7118]|uniref:YCII-related domain-containing protein n=1 Tax=Cryptococcus wingfieldii CBS 7118 TaxID=1295528 RepID=A0A1E3JF23_9TREE|nr:hypothetical protein L198_03322 [Cryptococcus wingfieldii CBS 7118]ODN99478.1 hypothetical protein L198_03322 [Cryptococcus wingfieldii CBS 7118]